MKQEAWITAHVNTYRFFGGVTRILTPDSLKNGVVKNSREETVLNKSYQEMAPSITERPSFQHGPGSQRTRRSWRVR